MIYSKHIEDFMNDEENQAVFKTLGEFSEFANVVRPVISEIIFVDEPEESPELDVTEESKIVKPKEITGCS